MAVLARPGLVGGRFASAVGVWANRPPTSRLRDGTLDAGAAQVLRWGSSTLRRPGPNPAEARREDAISGPEHPAAQRRVSQGPYHPSTAWARRSGAPRWAAGRPARPGPLGSPRTLGAVSRGVLRGASGPLGSNRVTSVGCDLEDEARGGLVVGKRAAFLGAGTRPFGPVAEQMAVAAES